MKRLTSMQWFLRLHRLYHYHVEPRILPLHVRVLLPLYIRLGGVLYVPPKIACHKKGVGDQT